MATDASGLDPRSAATPAKPEPRGPRLADLLLIVAGFAIGLTSPNLGFELVSVQPPYDNRNGLGHLSALWTVADGAFTVGLAAALAILVRRIRFGGMPRPAEWFLIVLAMCAVGRLLRLSPSWPESESVSLVFRPEGLQEATIRDDAAWWSIMAFILGLAISPMGRRPWVRTIVIATMALALLCGPLRILRDEYAIPPTEPRGPTPYASLAGSLMHVEPPATWPGSLLWHGRIAAALIPEGLFFGIPAVAAFSPRARKRTWTEWIGLGSVVLLAACWVLDGVAVAADRPNTNRFPDIAVRGLWLAIVVGLSVPIANWLGRVSPSWFETWETRS